MPEDECEAVAELSASEELPAAQLPACCRPKAWVTADGLCWKSTQSLATGHAEHEPLPAGDHFKLEGPTVASLV